MEMARKYMAVVTADRWNAAIGEDIQVVLESDEGPVLIGQRIVLQAAEQADHGRVKHEDDDDDAGWSDQQPAELVGLPAPASSAEAGAGAVPALDCADTVLTGLLRLCGELLGLFGEVLDGFFWA